MVFCVDVKGDLFGICVVGSFEYKFYLKLIVCVEKIGFEDYGYGVIFIVFWDVFGDKGYLV